MKVYVEEPVHASQANVVCPETDKPTRVRMEFDEDGKKFRVSVRSGAPIPYPPEAIARSKFRSNLLGDKDTAAEDVLAVEEDEAKKGHAPTDVEGLEERHGSGDKRFADGRLHSYKSEEEAKKRWRGGGKRQFW